MDKRYKVAVVVFLLAAVTCIAILSLSHRSLGDDNKAYGNVDIRQSNLSFERPGKIQSLLVDEGNKVAKGELLATLDTQDLDYQIQIKQSQCNEAKASLDSITNGYRIEDIEKAKAVVDRLTNNFELSQKTYQRYLTLFKKKSVSVQDKDQAYYTMTQVKAQLDEAQSQLEMLKRGNRVEDIQKAGAAYKTCQISLDYLNYQKHDQSVIKAPFDGIVRSRSVEIGDMASPSTTVFELSMTDLKRVRIYLTEEQLPKVKLGSKVIISNANQDTVEGTVGYISDTAMFTPKTVQTEELRASLVYEVRVDVKDLNNILRLGQSVTASFN